MIPLSLSNYYLIFFTSVLKSLIVYNSSFYYPSISKISLLSSSHRVNSTTLFPLSSTSPQHFIVDYPPFASLSFSLNFHVLCPSPVANLWLWVSALNHYPNMIVIFSIRLSLYHVHMPVYIFYLLLSLLLPIFFFLSPPPNLKLIIKQERA